MFEVAIVLVLPGKGRIMRHVIGLLGVVCCALGLWGATAAAQHGLQDRRYRDCMGIGKNADFIIQACTEWLRRPTTGSPVDVRGQVYGFRGRAYNEKDDFDSAIADLSEAIRLEPSARFHYLARSKAHEGKGDLDRSIADYSEYLRRLPPDDKLNERNEYRGRGNLYAKRGDFDRAIADFSEVIRYNPRSSLDYALRGDAYLKKRDFDRAVADYSEAIRFDTLQPKSGYSYLRRGDAYIEMGDFDHAIASYGELVRLYPDAALPLAKRGQAYEAYGDSTKAIEDYNKVLAISAKSQEERDAQADVRRRLATLKSSPPQAVAAPSDTMAPTVAPLHAAAPPGRRVALVIGNSGYSAIERLANPANDARAVGASLRRLGFAEVIERYDLSLAAMVEAFKAFGDKTSDADWAIVYYAGHGIEMGGTTYLIPTDARLLRDAHVPDEALPLDRVLAKVETARKLPLSSSMPAAPTRS
jgi:tetratricopeptide (TPR) repeat protein